VPYNACESLESSLCSFTFVMSTSLDTLEIDADVSRAWSLPASLYTDSSSFAREKDRIFARTWQVVGHRHQLANAGDFFTTELQGEPLLLVRSGVARFLQRMPSSRWAACAGMRLAKTFSLRIPRVDLRPGWQTHPCSRI